MRGSIFSFVAAIFMMFTLIAMSLIVSGTYIAYNRAITVASEAAALTAARDLSTIVIADPHFGWVALTDWPAGNKTVSPAGEPIPIVGINTILSTCRSNLIIAQNLGNQEMQTLALSDINYANQTAQALQAACAQSLMPTATKRPVNRDGSTVNAYADAQSTFLSNLPAALQKQRLVSFNLSLGWLSGNCTSGSPVPQPASLNNTPANLVAPDGSYMAFVDVPTGGQDFYFAGLSKPTSLVSPNQFLPPDGKRLCSAVRVDAALNTRLSMFKSDDPNGWTVNGAACALPGSNPDLVQPAVMAIVSQSSLPPGITSVCDVTGSNALASQPADVQIAEGDLGGPPSYPQSDPQFQSFTVGQFASKSIYDWLRTAHGKEQLDKMLTALKAPLTPTMVSIFLVQSDGTVSVNTFSYQTTASTTILDQQNEVSLANFNLRDEVSRIGPQGGRHCGRPLTDTMGSDPISQMFPQNGLAVEMDF
jgi:hypothetical protein